jgi:hypothetical protein
MKYGVTAVGDAPVAGARQLMSDTSDPNGRKGVPLKGE